MEGEDYIILLAGFCLKSCDPSVNRTSLEHKEKGKMKHTHINFTLIKNTPGEYFYFLET